jgi:nucleoside-diphosphate-sugar epimerase
MARVLITGSTAGLGRAAARQLLDGGHEVVLHADRRVHAVDPGWMPTRMGGPGAPDDLELGALTQTWLAVSDHPEATGGAGYWYHQHRRSTAVPLP